ncbi:hypothetical protein BSLG_003820 [Batrachochytrium salamandrivorans]|nr:hypothetical protein BSLG_003820 [Batrachochytrium salamandrivorans]
MQKEVNSDVAEYKGYVIDGLSCNSNFKNVVNLVSSPFDITFLKKTLDEKAKGHIPVLIRLQISDENLIRRRAANGLILLQISAILDSRFYIRVCGGLRD